MTIDISAIVIFHQEGFLGIPAIKSFQKMVADTKDTGISVQPLVVFDRPDSVTLEIVSERLAPDDSIAVFDFGDLSLTRNAAIKSSVGNYVACFDGDDLWCADWLSAALVAARSTSEPAIFHPEYLYFFAEDDFDCHSTTEVASFRARSSFFRQPSVEAGVPMPELLIENIWSANCFCSREVFEKHPYRPFRRSEGIGIEDWSWNIETHLAGYAHTAVKETVHLIRIKNNGSLGQLNGRQGLLPHLSEEAFAMFYDAGRN